MSVGQEPRHAGADPGGVAVPDQVPTSLHELQLAPRQATGEPSPDVDRPAGIGRAVHHEGGLGNPGDLGVGEHEAGLEASAAEDAPDHGLEGSGPKTSFGGDTRRRAGLRLVNLNGVLGAGKGTSAKFSSNANTGGTCFGDLGGPIFVSGTTTLVAVVSFGTSSTCSGTSGAYRIDQPDDLAFLATFGISPP